MFIRELVKKNPGYPKPFVYHRLMESVRTPKGPRQITLLNLGKLDLPREDWKTLANRIEEIISGQRSFLSPSPHIESLAQHYAQLLRQKEMQSIPVPAAEPEWETVDLGSLGQSEFRTIGGEITGYRAFEKLGFPRILTEMGLSKKQIDQAALLIIGRLLHPASERETAIWGREVSALGELVGTDFRHLSHNALYRISDLLCQRREGIESSLTEREREAFGLREKIILYDLTNTYLAGKAEQSTLARYGRSKQKQNDSPLLTLALVLDEDGFPKASRVLPGNASEPATLEGFLGTYKEELKKRLPLFTELPTVVIDAGIATKENLELIRREGYHYITVSRVRPKDAPEKGLLVIREGKGSTIEVKRLDEEGEVLLYCRSTGRAKKEAEMKTRFQKRFEEELKAIAASLTRKRGRKRYEKVMERIGRLRERYPTISQFYRVEVTQERGKVTRIEWGIERQKELEVRFSGSYYIRSDRTDMDEKELWSLYMMLNEVEDCFRCLKSELGLRPVYHQKDNRMEGHLFISVLAYHLMASIQRELKLKGICHRWVTIRNRLMTHMRATTSITNSKEERIYLRQTGDLEPFHLEVYRALGLPPNPLKTKRLRV